MKSIRKKEGFAGQRAIIIPRKILSQQCSNDEVIGSGYITDLGYYPKAQFHYRKRLNGIDQHILIYWEDICSDSILRLYPGHCLFWKHNLVLTLIGKGLLRDHWHSAASPGVFLRAVFLSFMAASLLCCWRDLFSLFPPWQWPFLQTLPFLSHPGLQPALVWGWLQCFRQCT